MPYYNCWDYTPVNHDFSYVANIRWPDLVGQQLDWICGVMEIEDWLLSHAGPKFSRWAWNMAVECYDISVAFKYDKHRMLFLLNYSD